MRDLAVDVVADGVPYPEGPRWRGGRPYASDAESVGQRLSASDLAADGPLSGRRVSAPSGSRAGGRR